MPTIIFDTNIVYYLCQVSRNDAFDYNKFMNYCSRYNCEKALTIFTTLEILNKYKHDKHNVRPIFEFLNSEIHYIICEIPQKHNYYRIFKKCKNE